MLRLMLAALLAVSCGATAAVAVAPGVSHELATSRKATVADVEYDIALKLSADIDEAISGQIAIRFNYTPSGQPLQLDFRESAEKLHQLTVNSRKLPIVFEQEHLLIPAAALTSGPNAITVEFTAGDSSLNRRQEFLYTLFVPDRARTAFPLFDQPDLKAKASLHLDTPSDWTALFNAKLISKEIRGQRAHWQFAQTEPVPTYLLSFVAGRFETITRTVNGREMTMLHRETDSEKVARNVEQVFALHSQSLDWMEQYTGIPLPFEKLDFALIPAFQYGGMEHTGAIQYRASTLFLEADPTQADELRRASLIAHEVAHMWFGNLVTMRWFNDVWTKEVFANFMAAKIVNPAFPELDHDLNFLVRHYPGAYSVDRTAGANPIRQRLDNLNLAGQMYGPIIYQKAPIMMRQLELITGEEGLRQGMQTYLKRYAYGNASWPELIAILDKLSTQDLASWSEVWVDTPGRPQFYAQAEQQEATLKQVDPAGQGRSWPQQFTARTVDGTARRINSSSDTSIAAELLSSETVFNANGYGYGLFPVEPGLLEHWAALTELERGSTLVNLYEAVLEGHIAGQAYIEALLVIAAEEDSALLLDLLLPQLNHLYANFLSPEQQAILLPRIEATLWRSLEAQPSNRRQWYRSYARIAGSAEALTRLEKLWSGELSITGLSLSERDRLSLVQTLAIRVPARAHELIAAQLKQTDNPDNREQLQFLAPTVSASAQVRDAFFKSLADEANRRTEQWVLQGLANLHHPSRREHAQKYLPSTLELLEEIQQTGDIFFPSGWLRTSFASHNSKAAVDAADSFLAARPDYNAQLKMKILQSVDPARRACRSLGECAP
ncbi:peptidase M1 [Halioglobus maricola]|uniref:Aminopeptidase N n=1 Tax=Halioglobus maricola TaxID=2601894 RepID=A0A5P9NG47_9GAMM|nr:M1 family aminopeptidase [Halioglobus maricola]QFU74780.1 peptidase M1 [Halioglobus maricola]